MDIKEKIYKIAKMADAVRLEKINLGQEIINQMNYLLMYMNMIGLRIYDEDNEPLRIKQFKYEECYGKFYVQMDENN